MKGDVMNENEDTREVKALRDKPLGAIHFPYLPKTFVADMFLRADTLSSIDPELASCYRDLADGIGSSAMVKEPLLLRARSIRCIYESPELHTKYAGDGLVKTTAELILDLMAMIWDGDGNRRREDAKHAANVRHGSPGGSREKQEKIRVLWASGKYTSRDICAEQECAALGMSFSAARKALRNTPAST